MKKFLSILLLLAITLTSLLFCGCSEESELRNDAEFLMLQPTYVGDPVTDTRHTFKKEDFKVFALYDQNITDEVFDFTFEIEELKGGYYTIRFEWCGNEEYCCVPLELDIYE